MDDDTDEDCPHDSEPRHRLFDRGLVPARHHPRELGLRQTGNFGDLRCQGQGNRREGARVVRETRAVGWQSRANLVADDRDLMRARQAIDLAAFLARQEGSGCWV